MGQGARTEESGTAGGGEHGTPPPLLGVATAGFQVEGGFNGPGEPANNWAGWERAGRVEPSGIALDLWNRYEDALDRAVDAGADSFRLSIEWARVELAEGEVDTTALDRYAAVLEGCHERGLEPLVTLNHFTHPAWLGESFWVRVDAPDRFARWVDLAVRRLAPLCRRWVTLNEINVPPVQGHLVGSYPPGGRFDTAAAVRALDHLLTAHVLAYGVLKRLQPDSIVTTNNSSSSVYELDRLLLDILLARSYGVDRYELRSWLDERRREYQRRVDGPGGPTRMESLLRRLIGHIIPLDEALPRAVATAFASPHERPLDVIAIDFYDPVASAQLRLPGHRSAGGRNWQPSRNLWDDRPDPAALVRYCLANRERGMDLWVVENGLCNRVHRGRSYPRVDGWDRVRYLRENLAALIDAMDAGLRLGGYWHWTLADNYEWGSYEPRFGLYGVDRERGVRWSERDSMGSDAAGTFRHLADGIRNGDRSVLASRSE